MKLTTLKPRLATIKPKMATMAAGSWRTSEMNSNDRGYTYKWQQARIGFLKHNPLCVYCHREGRLGVAATVLDHIVPHQGNMTLFWDRDNWQPLCKPCHDTTKAREEGR